jgi:molybdopterin-guanine dinucleotide biosynthesis protein A
MGDLAAFVIAGGQSSRMGRDKAFLTLGGSTLLERALAVARCVSPEVTIVGQREKFAAYGSVIEDVYRGQGPLAGIHAALSGSAFELNLMIGVDTPFLDPKFVHYLVQQARTSAATVTVPVTSAGIPHPFDKLRAGSVSPLRQRSGQAPPRETRVGQPHGNKKQTGQAQPLCAVYRREFAAVAEKALRQGRNPIVPLFAGVTTREIGDAEMQELAFDPRMFDNLNTPEEWDQACRRALR